MSQIVYLHSNTQTDFNTGEVKTIENVIIKKIKQEDFVQIYLEDLSGLLSIATITELKLLAILWKKSEWNEENSGMGNKIIIVKSIKEEFANELNVNLQTINNTLSSLLKKKLILSNSRSVYYLNPKYFFKGFSKDRIKAVKTILQYDFE